MTTQPPPLQPPALTPEPRKPDTLWPTLCHVCALAGGVVPFGNIIGPIVIWQVKKDELPEVVAHAKEVLNFQITVMIALLACLPLMFAGVLLFFPLLLIGPLIAAITIGALVCTIIGIVKASEGRFYTYPMTIRFIK
ncbi:MAG: DUF4870 domain-containing protein [Verrucomicrobiota bacterium]